MAAPGVTVTVTSAPAPVSTASPTGTWFITGQTERGPVGVPIVLRSLADYTAKLGARVPYGTLYDAVDVFFREGGNLCYVSRTVGPASVAATLTLNDRAATPLPTLRVTALGSGTWGNSLSVAVIAGPAAGSFALQILRNSVVIETSTPCITPADAVAWSSTSVNVTVADLASTSATPTNQPAVIAATPLTGGLDDTANVTDTIRTTALAAFDSSYGPGQVSAPGITSLTSQTALANHAQANNRVALIDVPNTPVAATVQAAAQAISAAATDPAYAASFPWLLYPGVPTGTATPAFPRTVPGSAAAAGLMARNDARGDANVAAAGANGQLLAALDVAQTYNASDRDILNTAGVNVFRNFAGPIQLFGYRSLAIDATWTDLSSVRMRMQLVAEALIIGQSFEFGQIDGRGQLLGAFNGALVAMLTLHWSRNSLYGNAPSDSFRVNTSPALNTPAVAANRQLLAVISVRLSPSAELVNINITKYSVAQTLP